MNELGPRQRSPRRVGTVWPRLGQSALLRHDATTPRPYELIAYPEAWTPGTNDVGAPPVSADAFLMVTRKPKTWTSTKARSKGKFVLTAPMPDVKPNFDKPDAHRYTDAELIEESVQEINAGPSRSAPRFANNSACAANSTRKFRSSCWIEGVAAWIEPSREGADGTVFVHRAARRIPKAAPAAGAHHARRGKLRPHLPRAR